MPVAIMARYIARSCPRCRDDFGLAVGREHNTFLRLFLQCDRNSDKRQHVLRRKILHLYRHLVHCRSRTRGPVAASLSRAVRSRFRCDLLSDNDRCRSVAVRSEDSVGSQHAISSSTALAHHINLCRRSLAGLPLRLTPSIPRRMVGLRACSYSHNTS